MPLSIFRPRGKEEHKVSALVAKSLLPTLLALLRPCQYHSPGLCSNIALGSYSHLAAPTLGKQDLLTGSSSEGHCPGTGGGRNYSWGRAESLSSSDSVCLNVSASFLLPLLQQLGAFSSVSETCLSYLDVSESFTIRKG